MINVGDRVKCIDDSGTVDKQLRMGREYIVYAMQKGCCFDTEIDIGHKVVHESGMQCRNCHKHSGEHMDARYYNSARFVKVEESKEYRVVEVATYIKEETKELIPN